MSATASPRGLNGSQMASGIAVFCAFDKIADAATLVPNPRNPNKHSDRQISLLAKIIKHQGWRAPIVVSKRSGFVVTGHGRLQAAHMLACECVPVNYQDFACEADEYAHLIADNRIAELADLDSGGVADIIRDLESWKFEDLSLTGFSEKEILKLLDKAEKEAKDKFIDDLDASGEFTGVKSLKNDVRFASAAKYEIPEFRKDMILSCPSDLKCWAGPDAINVMESNTWLYNWGTDSRRGLDMEKTIIGFYTDDYRFENFWFDPAEYVGRLINARVRGCVSPNYSLWADSPAAVQIYNTYRSRWVGRYMQEAGIKIIPDVNFSTRESFDFCLEGIPKNIECIAIQIQTGIKDVEQIGLMRWGIRKQIDTIQPQQLLLYVGETWQEIIDLKDFPKELQVHIVKNRLQIRTSVMKSANKTLKGAVQ